MTHTEIDFEVKPVEFKKILVAIDEDDSQSSARAYSYAVNLAKDLNVPLGIASVLETHEYNIFEAMTPAHVAKDRADIEKMLDAYVKKAKEYGVSEVYPFVEEGMPGKTIVSKIIPKFNCDLLICGFKTRKVSDGVFIGSQASYLAKESSCSITIIK